LCFQYSDILGSHNSAELNNDVDEDIMHQLVTNKSLIADRQYTVQGSYDSMNYDP